MKHLLLYSTIILLAFTMSCADEEAPEPPHEVGTWELDSYLTINLPADYTRFNEGRAYAISDISFGGLQFESYTFEFSSNGNYEREIELSGQPDFRDKGTWELDDDELILEDEDGEEEEWEVERNENEQLWLSTEVGFLLIKDDILDTLSQEYVSGLTQEEFEALFDQVTLDLVYAFEKE